MSSAYSSEIGFAATMKIIYDELKKTELVRNKIVTPQTLNEFNYSIHRMKYFEHESKDLLLRISANKSTDEICKVIEFFRENKSQYHLLNSNGIPLLIDLEIDHIVDIVATTVSHEPAFKIKRIANATKNTPAMRNYLKKEHAPIVASNPRELDYANKTIISLRSEIQKLKQINKNTDGLITEIQKLPETSNYKIKEKYMGHYISHVVKNHNKWCSVYKEHDLDDEEKELQEKQEEINRRAKELKERKRLREMESQDHKVEYNDLSEYMDENSMKKITPEEKIPAPSLPLKAQSEGLAIDKLKLMRINKKSTKPRAIKSTKNVKKVEIADKNKFDGLMDESSSSIDSTTVVSYNDRKIENKMPLNGEYKVSSDKNKSLWADLEPQDDDNNASD